MSTFLHGVLNIIVKEAKDLPDAACSRLCLCVRKHSIDTYVTVNIGPIRIIKTSIIENNLNPKWYETFRIDVGHYAGEVLFEIHDEDYILASLGQLKIKGEDVEIGKPIEGWFDLLDAENKPNGSYLNISIQYTQADLIHKSLDIPECYFPLRNDCKVTLYQDAHTLPSNLQNDIVLANGEQYQPACAWRDIYAAIADAKYFIYISGWSMFASISLLRQDGDDKTSLGEMILKKASDGVRVLILVWNEKLSTDITDGVMGTHDEELAKYFAGSDVDVVLASRQKDKGRHLLESVYVSTIYSHHQKCITVDAADPGEVEKRRVISFVGGLDLAGGRWDTPQHNLFATLRTSHGSDFYQSSAPVSPVYGPRLPWHDIHCCIEGPAALDILVNFQERWRKQAADFVHRLIPLDDKRFNLECPAPCDKAEMWNVQLFRSITADSAVFDLDRVRFLNTKMGRPIDNSIHRAYVHNIRRAQTFLYIENQYFLGSAHAWDNPEVKANHLIPLEIAEKICKKINKSEQFSVYIVIPMFPEGDAASAVIQEILYWQHKTIEMMYKKIARVIQTNNLKNHPTDFLSFFCLGKTEKPSENLPLPEPSSQEEILRHRFMVYVHSKMMIVDDEYIIVGSANINQRSMGGNRDTEIAIGSYQTEQTVENRGGLPRGQVHGFRMSLWAEHTGTVNKIFLNPGSVECMQKVNAIAQSNLELYLAEEPSVLQGYLLKYPMQVDYNGTISAYPNCELIPDTTAPVLGANSGFMPNNLTS